MRRQSYINTLEEQDRDQTGHSSLSARIAMEPEEIRELVRDTMKEIIPEIVETVKEAAVPQRYPQALDPAGK